MFYQNEPIDWPLDSNVIRRRSDHNTFGMVRTRGDGTVKPHQGWDFYAPVGTPCYSVSAGRVMYAGPRGDLGLLLVVSIGSTGLFAAYAHLSDIAVKVGDDVTLGQRVASAGCTGNAAGMMGDDQHLHFEIRDIVLPGLGLTNRYSPLKVFGVCPMREPIRREGAHV
jgi:murein DD-endopeptidase MepM/ murein hydrolase activator NlpD